MPLRPPHRLLGRLSAWVFALCLAAPVQAAIIGTTGATLEIVAPTSTELNQLEDNSTIFLFGELRNVTLANFLITDLDTPGSYDRFSPPSAGSSQIAAGTQVDSYFVHYDVSVGATVNSGSVSFDADVLGIILMTSTFDLAGPGGGSDALLGASVTTYIPVGGLGVRGMEFGNDSITLSADLRTVSFTLRGGVNGVDQLRILTMSDLITVPEPGTFAQLGLGLAGLAWLGGRPVRRRRAREA